MKKIIIITLALFSFILSNAQNVGIGTTIPIARLHVTDSNVLFTGPIGFLPAEPANPPVSGVGTRLMWYPDKAAFRVGRVLGTNWNKDSIGSYSFAAGFNTRASQSFAVSLGSETNASGIQSTSFGYGSTASGNTATSMGYFTVASNGSATSMGFETKASGVNSTSMGLQTTASGNTATSMGGATTASGDYSTSIGYGSVASGNTSVSMGHFTIAKSDNSLVLGKFNDTTATNRLFEIGNGTADNARNNAVTVLDNGNVGIGNNSPAYPLNFANTAGDKISLAGSSTTSFGFGVQPSLMQIHTAANTDNIAFGYGSSAAFTERARIINNGTDGMNLKGRLHLLNGSSPLDVAQTGGVWLYKADNSSLLSFMGTQNNQNVGFYGGPVNNGWGFVYDAINSRVGIGTDNPTSSLTVNGQVTIDQKSIGGYGGLLLKGNVPGSNYPNIGFSIKNTSNVDVVGAMVQGELANNAAGNEAINLGFYTTESGFGSLSQKMVIMGNGNVGLGGTPSYKLHLGAAANGLRIEGPATAGTGASALSIGGTGDVVIDKPGQVGGRLTIKENGAIAVGGSEGAAGQVLTSNGSGSSPTWQNASGTNQYNSFIEKIITHSYISSGGGSIEIDELAHALVLSKPALVTLTYNLLGVAQNCALCGIQTEFISLLIDNAPQASLHSRQTLQTGTQGTIAASRTINLPAGTHTIKVFMAKSGGGLFTIEYPPPIGAIGTGYLNIQVVSQ